MRGIISQYISRPSKASQYSISIPSLTATPKNCPKIRKHQLRKGSVDFKFHPNTLQNDPKFHFKTSQDPPKRPNIPFQYPFRPQHPKIGQRIRKHHPNTLQNDPKFNFKKPQDPPKRPNIQSQYPFRSQHPKIGQKIRKHQLRKGSVRNSLSGPPQLKLI